MERAGTFQLSTRNHRSPFEPHIGAVLNVTPDHLDRHYTFERYAAAKARLFENQRPGDFAVLNADDPATRSLAEGRRRKTLLVQFDADRPARSLD